jgi:pimeloyl-ACP methyl ester carboxylesterase
LKPFRSHRIALRGLDSHVLTWGEPAAPKLFLLHGWMDVAASFQFLVDAFARDWYVIAPDLRGYGKTAWQPQGYWYADYIADLEALVLAFAPERSGESRRAQSSAATSCCTTPACARRARAA